MEIVIEPYNEQYANQLKQLLHESAKDLVGKFNSDQFEQVIIAVRDDQLVGAVLTWRNSYHPHCIYFRTITHVSFPRKLITKYLLDNLKKVRHKNFPLITSFWEESDSYLQLYVTYGFKVIRKTFMPILKIEEVTHFSGSAEHFVLKTVEEIKDDEATVEDLVRLVKRNYESSHKVNPVADLSLEHWKDLIFSEDLVSEGSYLYVQKNQVIAYAFLHETDEDNLLEIGWIGARESTQKEKTISLVSRQFDFARKQGFEYITGEFDTTDEYSLAVMESLQLPMRPAWLTLQKR